MAKAYTDSQRLAYSEKETHTVTFDGDATGKEILNLDFDYVKMLDYAVGLDEMDNITVRSNNDGKILSLNKGQFFASESDGINIFGIDTSDDTGFMYVISVPNEIVGEDLTFTTGTYFAMSEMGHTSSITYTTKTVKTIDPELLPGVCLPIVKLDTIPVEGEESTVLSAEDVAKMTSLNGLPGIITINATPEVRATGVFSCVHNGDSALVYCADLVGTMIMISRLNYGDSHVWLISTSVRE